MAVAPAPLGRSLPPARSSRAIGPNATLLDVEVVSPSIRRLRIGPDEGVPAFRPGQYFAIGVEGGGRLLQRPYSAASVPDEHEALEFLIRLVPSGALTPRLWRLDGGARVHVGRPKGLFGLVPDDRRAHLFVATGTGIAPFVSMIRSLAWRRHPPRIVVIHGASRPGELAYAAWLRSRSGVTYLPAVSRRERTQSPGWTGFSGRVGDALEAHWPGLQLDPGRTVAYLCGNPGMIAGMGSLLGERGLPAAAIRAEEYWSPPAPGPTHTGS